MVVLLASGMAVAQQQRVLHLSVSNGQLIQFPRPARSVFIADPAIADVQVPSRDSVIVFGRKPGQTTLFATGEDDKPLASIQVIVGYELGEAAAMVHKELPDAMINLKSTPNGIVMDGTVPDADTANKVRAALKRYLGDTVELLNELRVAGSQQVNLRVRVAEISRTVTKDLGFNWQSVVSPGGFSFGVLTGTNQLLPGFPGAAGALPLAGSTLKPPANASALFSPTSAALPAGSTPNGTFANFTNNRSTTNALLDALADEGLVTILAEPNLTAVSGQPASFLAGGEFPIPVAQSSSGVGTAASITVDFKQFGVSLAFVPTVLTAERISLKVRPEVSELTSVGGVDIAGFVIPALTVRRAETTVELGSGQSFAIAGLIQNNSNVDINKYPGLGDVPVLGSLFRSSSFQRNETELVIIVTPYVVRPVSAGPSLKAPTDSYAPASDIERIFLDRLTKSAKPGAASELGVGGARLHGDAGFIVD
ncbi:MAG TPA: type II and III secretion system protein family protein [Stellaceae bacterium]|nr:type II and III secretion system protein family protein [Stellaceae bacterium]